MSVATENFVKAIYQFSKHSEYDTKPSSVAKKLGITSAAATDMSKKLALKGLLDYKKYQELKLTAEGELMALRIVRKHRIWESLLFKILDLSLHEIHQEAELLEHETSDFLAEKIHEYLGFPDFDPHGDPIPDINGKFPDLKDSVALSKAVVNKNYRISRLQSDDKEFFDFCAEHKLTNGELITVEKQFKKTQMTQVKVNGVTLLLNYNFTSLIQISNVS